MGSDKEVGEVRRGKQNYGERGEKAVAGEDIEHNTMRVETRTPQSLTTEHNVGGGSPVG